MEEEFLGMPYDDVDDLPFEYRLRPTLLLSVHKHFRRVIEHIEFTDALVKAAKISETERWWRDITCHYLALRIRPPGSKSYYLLLESEKPLYPDADGQEARRDFLGSVDNLTVAQARKLAELKKNEIVVERYRPNLRRDSKVKDLLVNFEQEYPSGNSEWSARRNELLRTHLISKYGDEMIARVRKVEWELLVQTVALDQTSRGEHLRKGLGLFLSWAVKRGALQANPLARFRALAPPPKPMRSMEIRELVAVYDAAQRLGAPWDAMFGVMILTGAPFEYVRRMHANDIYWFPRVWFVGRNAHQGEVLSEVPTVHLTSAAMQLLEPYRTHRPYIFQSNRLPSEPINLYPELLSELRRESRVAGNWGLKDCRRALRRELGGAWPGRDALTRWEKRFTDTREKILEEAEQDSVVL